MGGAVDMVSTLESCWEGALTLGGAAGVGTLGGAAGVGTLGVDAGSGRRGSCLISGGCWSGEKMALKLSMARSWSSVLVGERSALIAVVRARRQWMIRSSVVKAGRMSV